MNTTPSRSCVYSLRRFRFAVLLALFVLLAGCAAKSPRGFVRDIERLPQDLTAYLDPATEHARMVSPEAQQELAAHFLDRHFEPWRRSTPSFPADEFTPYLDRAATRTIYGENTLPRPASWAADLRRNADMASFPNLNRKAVAVADSSLRLLPTLDPMFNDFSEPGEGFPFDMAQNSAVWAGTPLFVAHLSADRDWALVETRYAGGWMPVTDLAFTDQDFMDRFRAGPFAAIVRDRVPVIDDQGLFRQRARIGALLPVEPGPLGDDASSLAERVLTPVRRPDGSADLIPARLPRGAASLFPLALTPWNVAAVGNQLLGEPYGWGGLFMKRDCSATMLDLFAPFGVILPRNSKAQAQAGRFVSLAGLSAPNKEAAIAAQAAPLSTLLYKPGHIMLYAGQRDGRAVILHNLWGLRSDEKNGPTPGRIVIGRAVITTLTPGAERSDLVKPRGLLLEGISGMTLLLDRN
ncbi:SH3 domain-containing protein [Paucidesulfovibrio longus]|uniref:SH3 domain-containing protein n=1 Tax=Paucidesulfovibrio longus TaxID=889 RepID=UPI0003B5CE9A|nr:NlpC/P60 family N-terminal domain-containing protein [Paucidesulfovibrio longus]